jgi:D-glycero-D-manno-heptose 1,7-bisphosphate phosphatase
MSEFLYHIDSNWTLFLDRDGVINKRPPGDYIKKWAEFEFLPGVREALKILAGKFDRIIVITNQQGIGKGLMTKEDLENIHANMKAAIAENGGRIDAVYYCPDLATDAYNCRKPSTFMAEQAKKDFPEIDFPKSMMVGDTLSDMEFGRNAGMKTVFINSDNSLLDPATYDYSFIDLLAFAKAIGENH